LQYAKGVTTTCTPPWGVRWIIYSSTIFYARTREALPRILMKQGKSVLLCEVFITVITT